MVEHRRDLFSLLRTGLALGLLGFAAQNSALAEITAQGDVSDLTPNNGTSLTIGIDSLGLLTIDNQSSLSSTLVSLGEEVNSIGQAIVSGFFSEWTSNDEFNVGVEGVGRLEIQNGASIVIDSLGGLPSSGGDGDLFVGESATGIGTVIVDGFASVLRVEDDTQIGVVGTGLLRISDDGFADFANATSDITAIGTRGRVELQQGRLQVGVLTNAGVIAGTGRLESLSPLANAGRIEVASAEHLIVEALGGSITNTGLIEAVAGEVEFLPSSGVVTNAGEMNLRDGVFRVRASAGLENTATFAATFGASDVFGDVTNAMTGEIVVAGEGGLTFHDPVTNDGTLTVFPGATVVLLDGLTSGAGATLSVEIAGLDDVTQIGQVEVLGDATLGGTLRVALADGFSPDAGDAFRVLSASGALAGDFSNIMLPSIADGLAWLVDQTDGMNVTLRVLNLATTSGDYNGDGLINAIDYVAWRDTLGDVVSVGTGADGNINGTIDQPDYTVWSSSIVGAASAAATAVPEPGAGLLAWCALVALWLCHRSIRRSKIAD